MQNQRTRGQRARWFKHRLRLDSQTLAALGATGIDHCATATGFHANEEAVGTCAANFGGLVSAFHFEFLANSVLSQQPHGCRISVDSP